MSNIQDFLKSVNVPNTAKVIKYVLYGVEENIEDYSISKIEQFILNKKPSSPKEISTICYVLGLYARWLEEHCFINDAFYKRINEIDKKTLWKKAKPNSKKKFITYEEYTQVLHDIEAYEEFNPLFYQTLFRCLYEGVYNDDMSVLANLRASDIKEKKITLHEDDGHTYKIKVSDKLAIDLAELSCIDIWERKNKNGVCRVNMHGKYHDSPFKVEKRSHASEKSHKFTYYSKLRKICQEYVGRTLSPFEIYVSGIMYRIKTELSKKGIPLEEAFSEHCRNIMAHEIISKELMRCNYESGIGNFRAIVKGHLDSF